MCEDSELGETTLSNALQDVVNGWSLARGLWDMVGEGQKNKVVFVRNIGLYSLHFMARGTGRP